MDTSVATVSKTGVVTAQGTGSTTILVSNQDTTVAVSVIVNKSVVYEKHIEDRQADTTNKQVHKEIVDASKQKVINSEMLRYLYETKQVLKITGDGYTIEIDGKDIVNDKNEFFTDLALAKEAGKTRFVLNRGKGLCGKITVYLEEPVGRYLYLYNESEEKYELLDIDIRELELTTPGEYQLCETKLKPHKKIIIYGIAAGVILSLLGSMGYILLKKKYWFW